jgi:hypothetical protein
MSINGIHVKKFMRAESYTIVHSRICILLILFSKAKYPTRSSPLSIHVLSKTQQKGTIEQVAITMLFIKLHSILTIIWIKHEPKHWKSGTASQHLRSCKFSYNQDSAHHRMQSCDNRKDTIEIRSCKVCMMNLSYLAPLCR